MVRSHAMGESSPRRRTASGSSTGGMMPPEASSDAADRKKDRHPQPAAVADAVRAIGYTGAGTLEFLRDPDGNLWFMEMNVRLQVEHAVSEMLTLVDLVKWQIRTAAGVSLPFSQTDIPMKGAVIECRINALSPGTVSLTRRLRTS